MVDCKVCGGCELVLWNLSPLLSFVRCGYLGTISAAQPNCSLPRCREPSAWRTLMCYRVLVELNAAVLSYIGTPIIPLLMQIRRLNITFLVLLTPSKDLTSPHYPRYYTFFSLILPLCKFCSTTISKMTFRAILVPVLDLKWFLFYLLFENVSIDDSINN